jgi:hypothetical protein
VILSREQLPLAQAAAVLAWFAGCVKAGSDQNALTAIHEVDQVGEATKNSAPKAAIHVRVDERRLLKSILKLSEGNEELPGSSPGLRRSYQALASRRSRSASGRTMTR